MSTIQHICICCFNRAADESDTQSTDDERSWGGLGKFEYSAKGLPHALVHARELVERGGHHGAYCTSASESGHKKYIKLSAKI